VREEGVGVGERVLVIGGKSMGDEDTVEAGGSVSG
jgi:hypothetical protein